jgi:hypothetical protein
LIEEQAMDALRILTDLNEPDLLPVEAIRAAQDNRDAMVPVFLQCIDECLASEGMSAMSSALFFVFHLLGEWREKSAYRPLAKLLRLPGDAIEPILGGASTESVHRVMAAVFDGDPDPLYEIILDKDADEFIRSRMSHAVAMLTRRGELSRDEARRFLRDCSSQLQPQEDCFVWSGWLDAIAWLGLDDLKPLARQAFARGSVDPTWLTFEDFEQDLRHGVAHPDADPLHLGGDLSLFGDTIAELSGWYCFNPEARSRDEPLWSQPSLRTPERNPFRKVGRNDPCPCGSGKKFKKCCLASGLDATSLGHLSENFLTAPSPKDSRKQHP